MATEFQKFRPKARLIRMIGDELISSPRVALIELVKNAYDADAETVTIRYDEKAGSPFLYIKDDGIGMSSATLLNTWFIPATSAKKKKIITERGRRVLGEKGIGRFAAATLGERLQLVTRQKAGREIVARVDWGAFDDDEAYLDEVELKWRYREPV